MSEYILVLNGSYNQKNLSSRCRRKNITKVIFLLSLAIDRDLEAFGSYKKIPWYHQYRSLGTVTEVSGACWRLRSHGRVGRSKQWRSWATTSLARTSSWKAYCSAHLTPSRLLLPESSSLRWRKNEMIDRFLSSSFASAAPLPYTSTTMSSKAQMYGGSHIGIFHHVDVVCTNVQAEALVSVQFSHELSCHCVDPRASNSILLGLTSGAIVHLGLSAIWENSSNKCSAELYEQSWFNQVRICYCFCIYLFI